MEKKRKLNNGSTTIFKHARVTWPDTDNLTNEAKEMQIEMTFILVGFFLSRF